MNSYYGLLGRGYLDELWRVWIKSKVCSLVVLFLRIHLLCKCLDIGVSVAS